MSSAYAVPTIFRKSDPQVMICSAFLTHPPALPSNLLTRTETLLIALNVGTILNVSQEIEASRNHRKLYERLNIKYLDLPIEDTSEKELPSTFLDQVLKVYEEHDKSRALMINCSMGVNRSSLAAGAILWTSTQPRPWKTAQEMIDQMRQMQREKRGIYLLTNPLFEKKLVEFCLVHS